MEAQHKLNGLGLPRQWKVITSTLLLLFTLAIGNVLADSEIVDCSGASGTGSTGNTNKSTSTNYTVYFTRGGGGWSVNSGKGYQGKNDAIAVFELAAATDVKIIISNSGSSNRTFTAIAKPFKTIALGEEFISILAVSNSKPAKYADCVSASKNYAELPTTSVYYKSAAATYCSLSNEQLAATPSYTTGNQTLEASKTKVEYALGTLPAGVYAVGFSAVSNSSVSLAGFKFTPACTNLDAPTGLSCTAQTVNTLTFGWSAVDHVSGYIVKLWDNAGCTGDPVATDANVTATSKTFTGLSNSSTYYCKVQSKGNGTTYCEDGNVTAAANGTTETPSCGVVTAPTSLLVGATTADGASFTIIDDADAFNYEFYVSESSTEPESSATATHTSTDKTKDVTGLTSGTTYYAWVRSVCDADHKSAWTAANKSFKVRTNPTASFANANYFIGASAIDVSANFTSNSEAAVVYELKESYPNVTLSGSSFSATVAGAYVVVANQAGNSDYMPISKEATITVLPALTYLIENRLNIANGDPWGSNIYTKDDSKITNLSAFNPSRTGDGAINVNKKTANGSRSSNISSYTTENAENYMVLAFKVADGFALNVSAISVMPFSVSDQKQHRAWITDADGNMLVEGTKTLAKDACENVFGDVDFSSTSVSLTGVNYLKLWTWGSTNGYRLNTPIYIDGEIVSTTPIAPAITAPTTDQTAEYDLNDVITPLEVTATGYPAPAYQWYSNTSASKEGATTLIGETDASYTPANDAASDLYYYCVATNTSGSATSPYFHVTVNAPTVPTIYTETTAMSLVSNKVATDSKKFTFSGINLDVTPVTLVLASEVDGLTLSTSSVTPTAGSIADTEVTVSYKSVVDVTEANVDLYLKHGDDILHTIVLTYSSTAGVVDLTPISAATTWNWDHANSSAEAIESLDANNIVVFANYSGWDESFKANSLAGRLQYVYRGSNYAQGHNLKFNTTVPGMITVSFSNTSTKEVARAPRITDTNGSYAPTDEADGAKTADAKSYSHAVAAGDVLIEGFEMQEGTPANMLRFYEVRFVPTHTVTYKAGDGTGDDVVDADATEVRDGSTMFTAPTGQVFNGWKDELDNDVEVGAIVSADMALTAQWINHYAVTFNMNDHGEAIDPQDIKHGEKATRPDDPVAIGFDFGGWFTDNGTFEAPFDFNTPITAATPLYAKWTAFDGCTLLVPATSGDAPAVGDPISMQTGSKGGSMSVVGTPLSYNAYGLSFESSSSAKAKVTINNEIQEGTVISLTLVANGTSAPRGLHLYTGDGATKIESLGWNSEVVKYTEATFTYTVKATDVALIGSNEFQLWRNGSVFLKKLTVTNCGDAITFHNLTSAVNIAGKGTVTLGASSVREGYTTTAEYSAIDPAYEFVSWSISGAGASIADASANPATITMGTEDAVVTLNLQLIPVKFTVNYFDGTTAMGTEQVVVNEHPTASEIKTAKRGYIFEGWAMSSTATASDVVALNTITSDVAATINLYAVYSEFPCPTSGNLFTWVIDPDADEIVYNVVKNVETEMVTAADVMTITGGTVAVGTTSNSATFTIVDGAFKFRENGNNYTRIELNCALQVGDVISYTSDNSANRYMSIYKDDMSGTAVTTAVDGTRKYFVASTESPIYGAYVLYIKGSHSDCSFKTLSIDRLAPATGVSLENATIAIGNTVTPTMTLLPSNDAYYESIAWSIVGEGEGTIANIDAGTGAVTALAAGSVTVQVKLNNDESLKATCTVEVISSFDQVDVTESTVWDMNNVSANAIELTGDDKNARLLLANIDGVNNNSSFNSQALMFEGQHIGRTPNSGVKHLAGRYVQFNVTKQGVVSVIFASNGDNQRTIRINDKKCTKTTNSGTYITYDVLVQPGLVEIVGMEGASDNQYIRISKITYTVKETPDYTRTEMLGSGVYGTICVDHNVPEGGVRGVTVYEIAGREPQYGKIAFDEVTEMAAGVPYVFIAHGNEMALYYGETTEANPVNGNGMYGTFEDQTLTELDGIYYFAKSALWSCVDLTWLNLPANRAYVKLSEIDYLDSSSPAPGRKRLLIGVNGAPAVATGFENVQGDNVQCTKVLINGQLFILRGEKMYDAKGQLVK